MNSRDLRLALRRLRKAPAFTTVAVVTLALAIGANTAIFSFADAVLFRPLPYEDPERVFNIRMMSPQTGARYTLTPYSYLRIIDERARTIAGVGMFEGPFNLTVTGADGAEAIGVATVSGNYFTLLGARPAFGRNLVEADVDATGRAAMLTWSSFRTRFGGDPSVVGSPLTLGDRTFDIVGVLPAGFVFPTPFRGDVEVVGLMPPGSTDNGGTFYPIVRLEPDATAAAADAELASLATMLDDRAPTDEAEIAVLDDVRSMIYPTGGPVMRFLLAAAGLVLLIGCSNLANMMFARTRSREREIGVQAALGASRLGRVRPLLIEGVIIGIAGGVAALLAAEAAFGLLLRQVPPAAIGQAPVGVGPRTVAFALGLGLVGGLLFATLPAIRASRWDAQTLLRSGGGRTGVRSFGRPLLAAQVALAIVLVFGAVIAVRGFVSVLQIPLGFSPENVATVRIAAPSEDPLERQAFYLRAAEELRSRSDIVAVGAVGSLPFGGSVADEGVIAADTGDRLNAGIVHVLPGYFEAAGIDLIRGRLPTSDDVASGADVAIIAPSTASALFGGTDPLGQTLTSNVGRRLTVVGVVADVTHGLGYAMEPPVYAPPAAGTRQMTLVALTRARSDASLADIRRQISAMNPDVPLVASWWSDTIGGVTGYRNPRFQTIVLGSFAGLALGLTAIGVFGLVSFIVAHRLPELGIRLAIGATPGSLTRHTIGHVVIPTLVGVGLGIVSTRLLARLAEAQLYEVDTRDPATFATAVLTVAVAAVVAAYVPARRAGHVDPMTVLRTD